MKSWILIPYVLASFVAAALLFAAEPMIGKMVLPPLGGTPAVWNICLLFFQAMLLLGYLLALAASRFEDRAPWAVLIVLAILLGLGSLIQPITIRLDDPAVDLARHSPTISLLAELVAATALPLGLISATSPLTQHWFARTGHPRAHDPYFLYAASNTGSLLALVSYPLWIEPGLGLAAQSLIWSRAYGAFAFLMLACGAIAARRRARWAFAPDGNASESRPDLTSPSPTARDWLRWLAFSAIPTSWLLGVTTFLTTNLAAMPLLWVIPLALFLIASILTFADSTRSIAGALSRLFPWPALALVLVLLAGFVHAIWLPLHLSTFFLGCLLCNARLVDSRPASRHATSFYLAIAAGGVLGGAINALAAPVLFRGVVEYPLVILCGCLVYPRAKGLPGNWPRSPRALCRAGAVPGLLLMFALPLTLGLFNSDESLIGPFLLIVASGLGVYATLKAGEAPPRFAMTIGAILLAGQAATDPAGTTLLRSRNFYGVVRVTFDRETNCRRLLHGMTLHGEQSLAPLIRDEPRTYFARSGPIGDIFGSPNGNSTGGEVAIVGLGIGTLAAYARPGERWTFYELDPSVVRIARDPDLFTYLADSRAEAQVFVTGDARLRIRDAADGRFSRIVLDAFGSDAVPVHLISREAIRLYLSRLAPGGLLVFNITNGYVDLEPVVGLQAKDAGLVCRVRRDVRVSPEDRRAGKQGSIWAVMGREAADLGDLAVDPRWHEPQVRAGARPWTDDYSDLASYLLVFKRRTPDR